jgi:alkylation response protein AidB-like acyl-CoA dehydrogenase
MTTLPAVNIDAILLQEQLDDLQSVVIVDNELPPEIFETLQSSGFLIQAVPEELGGLGLTLSEVRQQLMGLVNSAPEIVQLVNMHIVWTGAAADGWYVGDTSLEWLLRDACDGHFFATGERDFVNDDSVMQPLCKVERADGGYCFSGQLSVTSATAGWSRLGINGREESNIDNPVIVHAFVARDADGLTIGADGEVRLDAVFVPDKYIARVIDEGSTNEDLFLQAISIWMSMGFSNV